MARRFQREELLRLRDSPLVAKPANFPPLEEWMGVPPDQGQNSNTKRMPNRCKADDLAHESNNNRRPAYESRASRNNVSEDIILGPPRTAFASTGRAKTDKNFDPPGRASFATNDEIAKAERQDFRDKYSKDAIKGDRDGLRERRPDDLRLRRDDHLERWNNARTPRTPFDENERAFRKNGDRDLGRDKEFREAGRGGRGFDGHRRNGDREDTGDDRRNEPSWYREDEKVEEEPLRSAKDTAWREKDRRPGRGEDRDWGRPKNHEPAWMDDPQPEAKAGQAHTQEDFQKWKERMKAGNLGVQETPASPEPKANHERTVSGKFKGKAETPLVLESNFDGFFGMWGDTEKDASSTGGEEQPRKPQGKPSKFTNFFAPKTESKPVEQIPQSAPLPEDPKDADKDGFQRILDLLEKQKSSNSRNATPFHENPPRYPPSSPPPQLQSRQTDPHSIRAPLSAQMKDQRPALPSRDSEFLLRLMQQPQQQRPAREPSPPPPPPHQPIYDHRSDGPNHIPFSNLMISPHDSAPQPAPSGFPPGFFLDEKPGRKHAPHNFFDRPPPSDSALPPGLQRPPGLDQFPPQQQQRPQMMQPPPGLPPLMRGQEPPMRGPNPNNFPPPPGMGGPGDRPQGQGPQFGGRPPPGLFPMGAPPGFMPQGFGEVGYGRGMMDGPFGEFGGRGGQGPGGGYQR